MHIVVIDTTLTTPPFGGSHTFLVVLARMLTSVGWRVSVVTQRGQDHSLCQALMSSGVCVVDGLWRSWHLPDERAQRLAKWVKSERPDTYLLSNSTDTGWLALPLLPADLPVLSISHNDVSAYYEPLRHYRQFVDLAIGVSIEISRKLTTVAYMPDDRVQRIPYGVPTLTKSDAERRIGSCSTKTTLRIGYIGRIIQGQKRVFEMVAVARELADRGIDFRLDIVGDGPDRPALQSEFDSVGLADHVYFWGWLTGNVLSARYAECNVFLLMSEYEGLPVALLEAMGQALAPVVSRTASGNAEVVRDGENGFLMPIGDVSGFASRLAELARDPSRLAAVRRAAWETSQEYTVARMVDRYRECLAGLTARGTRPAGAFPVMASCRSRYPFWARKAKALLWAARGGTS